jgi:magnesium-transporting ATPase (P-type)
MILICIFRFKGFNNVFKFPCYLKLGFCIWKGTLKNLQQQIYMNICIIIFIHIITIIIIVVVVLYFFSTKDRKYSLNARVVFCGL